MPDRILVVDDEADILSFVKKVLEREGFHVITAGDGDEALRRAEAEIPDVVLLDVVMPGKSGLEVCRILKSQAKTKHTPIVMFTSLGRDVDRKLAAEAGADGFFNKPCSSQDLTAQVKQYLEKARVEKFSRQLGVNHEKLTGKKILFEFDPSTPYERLVRDFIMESAAHTEPVIVLTKSGSAVQQVAQGERGVEVINIPPDLRLSPLLEKHRDGLLSIVYDNLTDLALSTDPQNAYKFAQNATGLLSDSRITVIFLFNPAAHEERDAYSLRGLFSSQVVYGKQGVTAIRIT